MSSVQEGLSILKKFNFEKPPVGVKYSLSKPKGLERLSSRMNLCEMLPEAQKGEPFYVTKDDISCVGTLYLGMADQKVFESGLVGPRMKIFEEARANARLYDFIPRMRKGSVKYISFAPLDKLSFNPDVLVVCAKPNQAEILLRATSYRTGRPWHSKLIPVVECSYVFIEPYLSGKVNYVVSPVGFGLGIIPDGEVIVSFPYDILPELIDNLNKMEWVPELHKATREEVHAAVEKMHVDIMAEIGE